MPITAFQHSLASIGYVPDLALGEAPFAAWTDGRNMRFTNGAAHPVDGITLAHTATTSILHAMNVTTPSANLWVCASLAKMYVHDAVNLIDITRVSASVSTTGTPVPYTAAANLNWTSDVFGQYAILNDGVDVPQSWDLNTAHRAQNLSNWPSTWTAQSVRSYRNYLVAMDITISSTRYPTLVAWSDAATYGTLPATWVAATDNDAGDNDLGDTPGWVIDGLSLGGSFILYKQDAVWAMTYVGGATVMQFRKLFSGIGVMSRRCVQEFNNKHFFVGRGDIFVHDGTAVQSVAAQRIRDSLFNDSAINSETYSRVFTAIDRNRHEIWVCYPSGTDYPNMALVWNYETDVWYPPRTLPETAHIGSGVITTTAQTFGGSVGVVFDADTGVFDDGVFNPYQEGLLLCLPGQSALYEANRGDTVLGAGITSYLTKSQLPFDTGKDATQAPVVWTPQVKVVRRVWVDGTGTGTVRVYLGTQDTESGTPVWHGPFLVQLATEQFVWTYVRGRFFSIKFETDSSETDWRMTGYKLDWVPAGVR